MTASSKLQGLVLDDGWKIVTALIRPAGSTGGMFSNSYLAEKDGRTAFLKAFDFSDAFQPGVDTLKELGILTASYEHERNVLEHCRGRRMSHVTLAVAHGHVEVPGLSAMEGRVYYLLFKRLMAMFECKWTRRMHPMPSGVCVLFVTLASAWLKSTENSSHIRI